MHTIVEVNRAKNVLYASLAETEGKLWSRH